MSSCNCGKIYISKNIGLLINGISYQLHHNSDALLESEQVFRTISSKLNNVTLNTINLIINSILENQIKIVFKTKTNKIISTKYIGLLNQANYISNIILSNEDFIITNINEELLIEIHSVCNDQISQCCDSLPNFTLISLLDTMCIPPACDIVINIIT
jgi:hypothetical protein